MSAFTRQRLSSNQEYLILCFHDSIKAMASNILVSSSTHFLEQDSNLHLFSRGLAFDRSIPSSSSPHMVKAIPPFTFPVVDAQTIRRRSSFLAFSFYGKRAFHDFPSKRSGHRGIFFRKDSGDVQKLPRSMQDVREGFGNSQYVHERDSEASSSPSPTNASSKAPYEVPGIQRTYVSGSNGSQTGDPGQNTSSYNRQKLPNSVHRSDSGYHQSRAGNVLRPPQGSSLQQKVGFSAGRDGTGQNSQPGFPYRPPKNVPKHASSTAPGNTSSIPSEREPSAAAKIINERFGHSQLKLEKEGNPVYPPPRNPSNAAQKKSGKDLVAESAACAVIEKYLGPWPGFPPRDPKFDEYLDSLSENAACAAIDKYFGPYKPLFTFRKKESEDAQDAHKGSNRPLRNRNVNRAGNRTQTAWNPSTVNGANNRPWNPPPAQSNQNQDVN